MQLEKSRLYLMYLGIVLTIIGLPFSRAMISIGQVVMGVVFLFDPNLWHKLKQFSANKAAMAFVSFYFLMLIGLLYSSDISYGFFDLRTKLPLLLFPLVFATEKPLNPKVFKFFLLLFAATVTASISYSLLIYFQQNLSDYRDAFPFVSHIRISLESLIAISIFGYFSLNSKENFPPWARIVMLMSILYLVWALLTMELMTGIVILIVTLFLAVLRFLILNNKSRWSWGVFTISVFAIVLISYAVFSTVLSYSHAPKYNLSQLDKYTALGNPYTQQPEKYQIENGSYIGLYIQWKEMKRAWNQRAEINFDSIDGRSQQIKFTLLRYLNSKHLRKDARGVNALSTKDIHNIEEGIANAEYAKKFSLKKRIYKLLWEYGMYQRGEIGSGHTLIQRVELWTAGWQIFSNNILFGVGTGDIPQAFHQQLIKEHSPLMNSHLRSHNQYISIMVSLGIFGLIIFLFSIFYPPTVLKMWNNTLFFYFISFLIISMLWEDTIESQVGVTLFAFFYAFYLFARPKPLNEQKKGEKL